MSQADRQDPDIETFLTKVRRLVVGSLTIPVEDSYDAGYARAIKDIQNFAKETGVVLDR